MPIPRAVSYGYSMLTLPYMKRAAATITNRHARGSFYFTEGKYNELASKVTQKGLHNSALKDCTLKMESPS